VSTYDVRVWSISENKSRAAASPGGQARSSVRLRWAVAGERFSQTFATRALADSFRSKLLVAQREGVAFDEVLGLPVPMAREARSRTWFQHAVAFVDMKWGRTSPGHRRGIAEALANITPALLTTERGAPTVEVLHQALYRRAARFARDGSC
jgi:hypothetical protein